MDKVRAILEKEWREAMKNTMVIMIAILLPVIFVILPLVMLAVTRDAPPDGADLEDAPPGMLDNPAFAGLNGAERLQAFLIGQMMVLFLLTPLAIPMTIATYSIVGEKREKSLEPLLATPLRVVELLLGKALAASLPGVFAAWLSFALFAVGARFFVVSDAVYAQILSPTWLLAMLFLTPLLTLLAVSVGLIVSSRVNDPRAAEQIGMIVILPVLGLLFGQIAGVLYLSLGLMLTLILGLALLEAALIYFGVKLFERETILTRWK